MTGDQAADDLRASVADLTQTVAGLLSRVRALEIVTRPRPRDGGMFVEDDGD